jgi:C-terminal processing protease CtpA/Prc
MRLFTSVALAVTLVAGGTSWAEDLPEGSIGVRIELKDAMIVVKEPIKGGPADKAGLKPGDILVKVNDYEVKEKVDDFELERAVREIVRHKPGDKVKLGVKRDGKDMTVEVTVGKRSEIFPKDKD